MRNGRNLLYRTLKICLVMIVSLSSINLAAATAGPVVWGSGTIYLPNGSRAGAGDVSGYAVVIYNYYVMESCFAMYSSEWYSHYQNGTLGNKGNLLSGVSNSKGEINMTDGMTSYSPYSEAYINEWAVVLYVCEYDGYEYYKRINGDHYDTNSTLGQKLYSNLAKETSWIKGDAVPEPSSGVLLLLGLTFFALKRNPSRLEVK